MYPLRQNNFPFISQSPFSGHGGMVLKDKVSFTESFALAKALGDG